MAKGQKNENPNLFELRSMNNVSDPSKLKSGEVPWLINVDTDDESGVYLRPLDPYTGTPAVPLECFYNGRTYTTDGISLLYGASIEDTGTRLLGGVLEDFNTPITMLVEMVDGMYVGTQDEVVYISGGDPALGDMALRQVLPYGVASNTCCKVPNSDLGLDASGYSVVFLTQRGICTGTNGGVVVNNTDGRVAIPEAVIATATLRTTRNMTHYVVKIDAAADTPDQFISVPIADAQ